MSKIEHRYCQHCGSMMKQTRSKLKGYDKYTGKPWFDIYFVCPRKRWWTLRHDDAIITENQRHRTQLGEGNDD